MKLQKVDDGLAVPMLIPAVVANWITGMTCRTNYDVERDYRR